MTGRELHNIFNRLICEINQASPSLATSSVVSFERKSDYTRAGWNHLASELTALSKRDLNREQLAKTMYTTMHEAGDRYGRPEGHGWTPTETWFRDYQKPAGAWLKLADFLVHGELDAR